MQPAPNPQLSDFSQILVGLGISEATAAIISAGVFVAGLGFAVWVVGYVSGFFENKLGSDREWWKS